MHMEEGRYEVERAEVGGVKLRCDCQLCALLQRSRRRRGAGKGEGGKRPRTIVEPLDAPNFHLLLSNC